LSAEVAARRQSDIPLQVRNRGRQHYLQLEQVQNGSSACRPDLKPIRASIKER
jgi:hypothetical protein